MAIMPMPASKSRPPGALAGTAAAADETAMMEDTAAAVDDDYAVEEEVAPEGYVIEIIVKADGTFAVSKEDLRMEAEEGPGEEAMSYDSLGQAMKAVMDIVKQNPVGESEQSQFDAGYGATAT